MKNGIKLELEVHDGWDIETAKLQARLGRSPATMKNIKKAGFYLKPIKIASEEE